jgi:hypothetical protein
MKLARTDSAKGAEKNTKVAGRPMHIAIYCTGFGESLIVLSCLIISFNHKKPLN